jgi:hypothetical protein
MSNGQLLHFNEKKVFPRFQVNGKVKINLPWQAAWQSGHSIRLSNRRSGFESRQGFLINIAMLL